MESETEKWDDRRGRMVAEQIARRGIVDRKVLDAMGRVPRECFVRQESLQRAYADVALQIDCQQTISQPLMVAMMTEALALAGCERILEIGTGSGYQTAVLAELLSEGGEVFSVERHAELSRSAEQRLAQLGYRGAHLLVGDGSLGWPAEAPYDGILVTAAAPRCPPRPLGATQGRGTTRDTARRPQGANFADIVKTTRRSGPNFKFGALPLRAPLGRRALRGNCDRSGHHRGRPRRYRLRPTSGTRADKYQIRWTIRPSASDTNKELTYHKCASPALRTLPAHHLVPPVCSPYFVYLRPNARFSSEKEFADVVLEPFQTNWC